MNSTTRTTIRLFVFSVIFYIWSFLFIGKKEIYYVFNDQKGILLRAEHPQVFFYMPIFFIALGTFLLSYSIFFFQKGIIGKNECKRDQ